MKNSKLLYGILITILLIAIVISGYFLLSDKDATKIKLDRSSTVIFAGQEITIKATISPLTISKKKLKWVSSDERVATVRDGVVKGISEGKAIITASTIDGKIKSNCTVAVVNKKVQAIEVPKQDIFLKVSETANINAKVIPSDATYGKLKYSSSDPSVATVNEKGIIKAIGNGVTTITIKDEIETIKVQVRVIVNTPVASVKLNKSKISLNKGDTETLVATINPTSALEKGMVWSTSDSSVATIDQKGKVTAKKIGTATITVTTEDGNKTATCVVNVVPSSSFGAYKHVFILGIDGLGAVFNKVSSPNFDRIFKNYAYRYDAKSEYITISAQNWGSILDGVAYDVHGYNNDYITKTKHTSKDKHKSIFYYTHQKMPSSKLVSVVNWTPINNGIIENDIGVNMYTNGSDANITKKAIEYINSSVTPTLMFIHFCDVDHTAHKYGGFSKEYYNAAVTADKQLGQIFDALEKKGLMKDSLFIVVADHGETKNGHGGHTVEESSVLVAVRGHSVNKLTLSANTRNRDVSAIALYALGINKPSHFTSVVPTNLFGEKR